MTYCLAMRLDDGLVFMSDTRTNAGVDNIGTYRKLHVLVSAPDRVFVLQSAGNLATTQEVLDRIQVDIDTPGDHESLLTVTRIFEAALYIGRLGREVNLRHRDALNSVGADGTATFILGGQITGHSPDILLIYPEGNYIRASDDRPFLQIGESKYGKFLLEMAVGGWCRARHGIEDRHRIDDEHGSRQPGGRPALRPGHLSQPMLSPSRNFGSCPTPLSSAGFRPSGSGTCCRWCRTCLVCTTWTNSIEESNGIATSSEEPAELGRRAAVTAGHQDCWMHSIPWVSRR